MASCLYWVEEFMNSENKEIKKNRPQKPTCPTPPCRRAPHRSTDVGHVGLGGMIENERTFNPVWLQM